jgi:hypothetical protein
MNENELQIDLIIHRCLKTRIKHEYKDLCNIYKNNTILLLYNSETRKVTITINHVSDMYTFIINEMYPFYSPLFYFNNEPYSHYLRVPSQRFSEHIKKYTGKVCFCCSSLSCKYNWSPAVKLRMFIDELNKIRQHKRNAAYKILADKIKDNYLIDDIDLDSFLFCKSYV